MARVKLSGLIDDIRGTVSNVVFAPWKAGTMYVRSKSKIRNNPRSQSQQLMRTWTQFLSNLWFSTLTAGERVQWNDYAATEAAGRHGGAQYSGGGGNIIPGNTGVMSGFNAFLMINLRLVKCGLLSDYDPALASNTPPTDAPPPIAEDLAVSWLTPTLTTTWTDPVGGADTDMLRTWIRSYDTGCHRQLANCTVITLATKDTGAVRFTNGDIIGLSNKLGVYDLQFDVMTNTGVLSAPSQIFHLDVT